MIQYEYIRCKGAFMEKVRKELLDFADKNPHFVTEAIREAVDNEDFSDYTTEEVIMEHLSDEIVEKLVTRFKIIMDNEKNV